MKVRLFEIFTSIEGEGILVGTKTMFVRLAGCPFGCFYCDTEEALPMTSGTEYSIDEANKLIEKNLEKKTLYKVNFTGGEPLVQHEALREMAKFVKSKNLTTYLESSCYDFKRFSHVLPYIDILKIEFKTKDSEFVDAKHYSQFLENVLLCLKESVKSKKTTYIKIVVSSKTKISDFQSLVKQIFKTISKEELEGFVIQPTTSFSEPSVNFLLDLYDLVYPYYQEVRIIPQLHKIIGAS